MCIHALNEAVEEEVAYLRHYRSDTCAFFLLKRGNSGGGGVAAALEEEEGYMCFMRQ
jgi:hypothetical protein